MTHATTNGGSRKAPSLVHDVHVISIELTEDQAADALLDLKSRENRSQLAFCVEMGDIVNATRANDGDFAAALVRLAERTQYSVSTLRTRGTVSSRLPAEVRNHPRFAECCSYTVYEEIALSEAMERPRLFQMVLNEPPPADARGGRWRVNDIRRMMGRSLATSWTETPSEDEDKRQLLLNLIQDQALMAQMVAEREGGGISEVEKAVFIARTPYVMEQNEAYRKGREAARENEIKTLMDNPNLSNQQFLHGFQRKVEADAARYFAFAGDLKTDSLQAFGRRLAGTRGAFENLLAAVQACIDALPTDASDEGGDYIDSQTREAIARLALSD